MLNWQNIPHPAKVHADLDRTVIGQVTAKMLLSIAANNHFHRVNNNERADRKVEIKKSNILLIGPTGSGKTLLAETLATMFNAPFAIADATKYTSAGYVGDDVENIVRMLLDRCDWNKEKAESGIVYIDEIDKIAGTATFGKDVNGEAVQMALLKILEGTTIRFQVPQKFQTTGTDGSQGAQTIEVSTRNILFICGGAFSGLDEIVKARTKTTTMGFAAQLRSEPNLDEVFAQVTEADLVKFGFIPEFIGRLQTRAVLRTLTVPELYRILVEPSNCLMDEYQVLLGSDVKLSYTREGLTAVAEEAHKRGTGARGLRTVMAEVMMLVNYYRQPAEFCVDRGAVENRVTAEELAARLARGETVNSAGNATRTSTAVTATR